MRDQRNDEQGSILLEALVSGILLVITAVGVFSAFDAGTRASAEERHRAQAEGLAQADLARLRTMRISALSNLLQTKVVTIEKTPYTVESAAEYQTDKTGTASCKDGTASADYIQIRSTISWPSLGSRAPVVEQSLVAPPNGSVSAKSGSLAIQIEDAANEGVEGVGLSGTGAGTFTGITGENGCAIFGDLPAGNYTLTIPAPRWSTKTANPPKPQSTSVVEESTNTLALQYDFGGDGPGQLPDQGRRRTRALQRRLGGRLQQRHAESEGLRHGRNAESRSYGVPALPLHLGLLGLRRHLRGKTPTRGEAAPEAAIADALVAAGGDHAGDDRAAGAPPDGMERNAKQRPGCPGRRRRR